MGGRFGKCGDAKSKALVRQKTFDFRARDIGTVKSKIRWVETSRMSGTRQ